MAKVKQIGGSWSVDLNVGEKLRVFVDEEEVFVEDMDTDVNVAFYMKRRNKPNYNQF